jgi:hypothetical protein
MCTGWDGLHVLAKMALLGHLSNSKRFVFMPVVFVISN